MSLAGLNLSLNTSRRVNACVRRLCFVVAPEGGPLLLYCSAGGYLTLSCLSVVFISLTID